MSSEEEEQMPFHVFHKVPAGDGLYVRAKHVQLVERNPDKAIALFRAAIDAGDRVDSALKDMAIVMKQQNRSEEAIHAISSLRSRCSDHAQGSLDNVLLDLYKTCDRLEDQIGLLIQKLKLFHNGHAFNGKQTKTARSQGKKFQVSVDQEAARLLGNLGWAYIQQSNYSAAESVYRRALALEVDNNKVCNLGVCLMKQGRPEEAIAVLRGASSFNSKRGNSESHLKSYQRAQELILEAASMLIPCHRLCCDETSSETTNTIDSTSIVQQDREGRLATNIIDISSNSGNHLNINQEAKKIGMVAAAWMLACNSGQQGVDDDDGNDATSHHGTGHGHAHEEGSNHCKDAIEAITFSLPASVTSLPTSSYLRFQAHGQRRLPVFQDLTMFGSAAAY